MGRCVSGSSQKPHLDLSMRTVNRRPPPSARDCWLRPCQTCTSTSLRWTWPESALPFRGVLRLLTLYWRTRVCRRHSATSVVVPVPLFQTSSFFDQYSSETRTV